MSAAHRYVVIQQDTASKERLTVMLFETAVRHMRVAIGHLEKKRRSAAMPLLAKSSTIVGHLHATLKRDVAPRMVDELTELYTFTVARLTRAMATGNPADVREAERAFAPIADGFAQAVAIEAQRAPPPKP
jgi:flagellar biosynthetic protein FliS